MVGGRASDSVNLGVENERTDGEWEGRTRLLERQKSQGQGKLRFPGFKVTCSNHELDWQPLRPELM